MPLAALPFLLIPYDSLTYLIGLDPGTTSQTLPATAVFSLLYLLLRGGRLEASPVGVRVFQYLCAAASFIGLVTVANILMENSGLELVDGDLRQFAAPRQGVSLILGLSTYLMFLDALVRIGFRSACRWTVVGGLPSLGLCAFQILRGNYRLQGFSSEPSQLGDMLVLAFLPACVFSQLRLRPRMISLASGLTALLATFSGTAYMKAVFAVFASWAAKGQVVRGLAIATIASAIIYGVLSLYPDNYVFHLMTLFQVFLDSGTLVGGSFIDRFFGFVGPVRSLSHLHGWLGFGLGGDSVYFDSFFDPATATAIRAEKSGIASVSSLQAKMFLYGGVVGYLLYLCAWWLAWRAAPRRHPSRFLIPTVFAASVFSLGPLFLPYIWLWLAIGSVASYVRVPGRISVVAAGHSRVPVGADGR